MTKKKISSLYWVALMLIILISALNFCPINAQAAPINTKDLPVGVFADSENYIKFGRYANRPLYWRVLEVYESDGTDGNFKGHKTAFLVLDDVLIGSNGNAVKSIFNTVPNLGPFWDAEYNPVIDSSIKTFLNGDFYNSAFNTTEKGAIITSSFNLGGEGYVNKDVKYDDTYKDRMLEALKADGNTITYKDNNGIEIIISFVRDTQKQEWEEIISNQHYNAKYSGKITHKFYERVFNELTGEWEYLEGTANSTFSTAVATVAAATTEELVAAYISGVYLLSDRELGNNNYFPDANSLETLEKVPYWLRTPSTYWNSGYTVVDGLPKITNVEKSHALRPCIKLNLGKLTNESAFQALKKVKAVVRDNSGDGGENGRPVHNARFQISVRGGVNYYMDAYTNLNGEAMIYLPKQIDPNAFVTVEIEKPAYTTLISHDTQILNTASNGAVTFNIEGIPNIYDAGDVQAINSMIFSMPNLPKNTRLRAAKPGDGSYVPEEWLSSAKYPDALFTWSDEESGKRVTSINLSNQSLTGTLNVSQFTALESLDCSKNNLNQIVFGVKTKLRNINCSDNAIARLDLSGFTNLEYLNCSNNTIGFNGGVEELDALKLSGCTKLSKLNCYQNRIINLDTQDCPLLGIEEGDDHSIICSDNPIKNLWLNFNGNTHHLNITSDYANIFEVNNITDNDEPSVQIHSIWPSTLPVTFGGWKINDAYTHGTDKDIQLNIAQGSNTIAEQTFHGVSDTGYDKWDVAVINNLIEKNGLPLTKWDGNGSPPDDWSDSEGGSSSYYYGDSSHGSNYVQFSIHCPAVEWTTGGHFKRIKKLYLSKMNLYGVVDISGLADLENFQINGHSLETVILPGNNSVTLDVTPGFSKERVILNYESNLSTGKQIRMLHSDYYLESWSSTGLSASPSGENIFKLCGQPATVTANMREMRFILAYNNNIDGVHISDRLPQTGYYLPDEVLNFSAEPVLTGYYQGAVIDGMKFLYWYSFSPSFGRSELTEDLEFEYTVKPSENVTAIYALYDWVPEIYLTDLTTSGSVIEKGGTQSFAVSVNLDYPAGMPANRIPTKTVMWTVAGATSEETRITQDGILKVGKDETAENLTVTARHLTAITKSQSINIAVSTQPYSDYMVSICDIEKAEPEKIEFSVNYVNNTNDDLNATALVAVYSNSKRLLGVFLKPVTLVKNSTTPVTDSVSCPGIGNTYIVKAMLWSQDGNLMPLANIYTFEKK